MKNTWLARLALLAALACPLLVIVGCSSSMPAPTPKPAASPTTESRITPPAATATTGTAINGEALMNGKCPVCHNLQRVQSAKKTRDEWAQTVRRMVTLPAPEETALLDYLANSYGK